MAVHLLSQDALCHVPVSLNSHVVALIGLGYFEKIHMTT